MIAESTMIAPGDNRLPALAAEIRREHEASGAAMKRGLQHAINAGRLLIEAKEKLPHGQWLPWLREHCQIPERTVQLYMRLARHTPEIRSVADLSIRGAIERLAPPPTEPDLGDWDDISEWAQRQLDGPFSDFDFPKDGINHDWIRTKLMHQAKLPAFASWCFDMAEYTEDRRPALRLCPWDDLWQAIKALAPIVNGERSLKFEFADMFHMRFAIAVVELEAMWLIGRLLHEAEYRERLDDERYEREWDEIHSRIMGGLEEEIAASKSEAAP